MVAGLPVSVTREDAARTRLRTRRQAAFSIGESQARRRTISADAYLFLYKELVMLAGERAFCWPGLDYLADSLETSEGTLKRWMRELERAGLIRRKPRPGGQTSLTYITAYLEPEAHTGGEDQLADSSDDVVGLLATASGCPGDEPALTQPEVMAHHTSDRPGEPPVFFGAPQQIISDQSAGSELIPHTVKAQTIKNLNGSGGGNDALEERKPEHDAIHQLLAAEAVLDPEAISELEHKQVEELQAVSRYLDKQRNLRCRPGLFVWLARQEFGAQLLRGRHSLEHCNTQPRRTAERAVADAGHMKLHSLWQDVLDRLQPEVPTDDWLTWLAPTRLLELTAGEVVIGTPNIFVRQEIEGRFLNTLSEALQRALGSPVQVHVVIEQAALLACV